MVSTMTEESDVEFNSLINGAVQRSISSLEELAGIATSGECLPAQYEKLVTVMYIQLRSRNIPHREDINVEELKIPLICLTVLGSTLPVWISCRSVSDWLFKRLAHHWQDVRNWIIFLYEEFISQPSVDINLRIDCKNAVLTFLGMVQNRLVIPWSRGLARDKMVMHIISHLWRLEIEIPEFHSWSADPARGHPRESTVLNSCILIAYETGTIIDWDTVLQVFDGDPDLVSDAAITHLRRELLQDPLDLECIALDIHIITALSLLSNVHTSLVRLGSLGAAVEALSAVVSKTWELDNWKLAAQCMTNATIYLKQGLADLDGAPLILHVLDLSIIPLLLKCEPLLPFTENEMSRESPARVLCEVIGAYTIYRSVLKQLIPWVDYVEKAGMIDDLEEGGTLHKEWLRFKTSVDDRRKLLRRDARGPCAIQHCHSERCTRVDPVGTFKRCGGCLHSYYCSKECQRYDWREGKHKEYCRRIQGRSVRSGGQMHSISCKDIYFFEAVIVAELRRHRDRITGHQLRVNVVEFNFTDGVVDVTFDSRRVDPAPFKIKCTCEKFAQERWDHLVEKARFSRDQVILVRAYIPAGMSRKILLRSYELGRVLRNEWGVENKLVFPYRLNLTFTCCGMHAEMNPMWQEGIRRERAQTS